MNKRKRLVIKNGMIGITSQVISLILQLISRKCFIQFIGVEILGINNTFISLLQTLSLAELGFQTAIVYSLYKPIHENDKKVINEIVNIYKIVYRGIGIIFIGLVIVLLPFLRFILKNIQFNNSIYLFFLLQASASTCTYFLAYKRTLLYADQKEYVYKIVDMIANIIFKSLQIVTIVFLENYYLYLILQFCQVYLSNFVVHILCKKQYPYLHNVSINKTYFSRIMKDVKQVFAGRMAGYVYNCTDNLVISVMISTIAVGYFNNYTTITNNLKFLTASFMSPIAPIIGNYLIDKNTKDSRETTFRLYTHMRFIFSLIIIIPMLILIDDFIALWVGSEYVLSYWIKILLGIDLFVNLLQGPCSDYIFGSGLFKYDKYIQIIGMITNIGCSVILANILGVEGVLIGTIISQTIVWIGKSIITYRYSLVQDSTYIIKYWIKNFFYFIFALICCLVCNLAYKAILFDLSLFKLLLGGVITELIIIITYSIFFLRSSEGGKLLSMFVNMITAKRKLK